MSTQAALSQAFHETQAFLALQRENEALKARVAELEPLAAELLRQRARNRDRMAKTRAKT